MPAARATSATVPVSGTRRSGPTSSVPSTRHGPFTCPNPAGETRSRIVPCSRCCGPASSCSATACSDRRVALSTCSSICPPGCNGGRVARHSSGRTVFLDPRSVTDGREPDPDRPPRRAARRRARARRGRRHRPRAGAPRRRGARVRGPLSAPGRAARRRPGRGRQPHLRGARLGLPARHRRLGLQPGRADLQVQLPRRRRRGAAGQGRAGRVPVDAARSGG